MPIIFLIKILTTEVPEIQNFQLVKNKKYKLFKEFIFKISGFICFMGCNLHKLSSYLKDSEKFSIQMFYKADAEFSIKIVKIYI